MSDRIVRDELLTSERYWRCSPEARNLFLSIVLSVDDAARMTGALFALRTRCMAGTVSHERCEVILAELVDCDLVRRYEVDGQPYLFVPRFKQRRRYVKSSRHPAPPNEINDLLPEKSDFGQTEAGPEDDPSPTGVRPKTRGVGVGVGVGVGAKPSAPAEKISPAAEGWAGITDEDRALWVKAYPAVFLDVELMKARAWVKANPKNAKSNWRRFLTNWLSSAQDRAPGRGGGDKPKKVAI